MAGNLVVRLVCMRPNQMGAFAQALTATGRFTFLTDDIVVPIDDVAAKAYLKTNARGILENIVAQAQRLDIPVK